MLKFRAGVTMATAVGTLAFLALGVSGATPAFAATARYVATTGSDVANTCTSVTHPCLTVVHAVSVATAGDSVIIAAGTYPGQVSITKSLKLTGAGIDRTIIAQPAGAMTANVDGQNAVVAISGVTVTMTGLSVDGLSNAGAVSCSANDPHTLSYGIAVVGGATLSLSTAAVRNVGNPLDSSLGGCQFGDGISVGTPANCSPACPEVGHATISSVQVTSYQKVGIAVRGAGSTLTLSAARITDPPSPFIASNGVEVLDGAFATISGGSSISGNECNLATACGSDFGNVNLAQSTGVLLFAAAAGTNVSGNTVTGNDIGIYAANDHPAAMTISGNATSGNRDEDIFVDAGTVGARVTGNSANNSNVGIVLNGPVAPPPPYSTPSPALAASSGNTFSGNTARGNAIDDMMDLNTGGNTLTGNVCGSGFPTKAHWGCP